MQLHKIDKLFNRKFPKKNSFDFDLKNNGIVWGDNKKKISKVLVTLDITERVADLAVKHDCDLVISHHPFFYDAPEEELKFPLKKRIHDKLVRNKIAAYTMHTNYDCSKGGMNDVLIEKLGFEKPKPLNDTNGLGRYVKFEACDTNIVLNKIKDTFNLEEMQIISKEVPKLINSLAICGGSGSKWTVKEAMALKIDLIVTGEMKYADKIYAHQEGQTVVLATHFMENVFVDHVAEIMKAKGLEVLTSDDINPVSYYK